MHIDATAELRDWIGKTETAEDRITPAPMIGLAATLDWDKPDIALESALPCLWHWLYFLPMHRQSQIGVDGHAKRGGFLPPIPLPRRMWAGGRLQFHQPLHVGDAVNRVSCIADVAAKHGRSGDLVFVLVKHEIRIGDVLALSEEHDIVYCDARRPGDQAFAPRRAADDHAWQREVRPDEVLLFRYSALTFNGHRIHYDRHYVTEVEGYPGLIVHGPLIATMLADLVREHCRGARIAAFEFRAVRPLFDIAPFFVCGRPGTDGGTIALWAKSDSGELAMEATARLA